MLQADSEFWLSKSNGQSLLIVGDAPHGACAVLSLGRCSRFDGMDRTLRFAPDRLLISRQNELPASTRDLRYHRRMGRLA